MSTLDMILAAFLAAAVIFGIVAGWRHRRSGRGGGDAGHSDWDSGGGDGGD